MRGSFHNGLGMQGAKLPNFPDRQEPDLSIVICFRDWGLDRLSAAIRCHMLQSSSVPLEVLVSDYGSREPDAVVKAVAPLGARVVRTEINGPWSRSASLNAGVASARGKFVITTDADIIFTPACYREALRLLEHNPSALYLIQCRDLSEKWGASEIERLLRSSTDTEAWWRTLDATSRIRPRWGMGGFAAFSRDKFAELNGYEERMQIWGGEDNDFATRFRRAGYPLRWLSRPDSKIFHIWHEPSQTKAIETNEGRAAVERNREILRSDASTLRNPELTVIGDPALPAVSIVVPTYRRAELLRACLKSIERQTWRNFEAIVVENGESDEAESVVNSLRDKRFRYIRSVRKGAAAARNLGVSQARGRYIVIHDDDDIMVSTRIADHLRAMRPGSAGSYSGWIDFEHQTWAMLGKHPGKAFSFAAVLCNGKVLTHGALMLDRRIFRAFQYEEELVAGIDYGFILNLARNGLALVHTGTYGILRRMHSSNMTRVNAEVQKSAALQTAELLKSEIASEEYKKLRSEGLAAPILPCQNEQEALDELRFWQDQNHRRRIVSFSSLSDVDEWLDRQQTVDIDSLLTGATPATAAIVRSRLASKRRQVVEPRLLHQPRGALVVFRFDDDRIGQWRYARPILAKAGFKASTYVITSHPSHSWSANVNWRHLQELHDAHGWEIGSHTRTHPDLRTLTDHQIREELYGSKQDIEDNLDRVIAETFAPPKSTYDERVLREVKGCFSGMTVGDGGILNKHPWDPYGIRSKALVKNTTLDEVKRWVNEVISIQGLLVISAHEITENPRLYTEITVGLYAEVVDLVKSKEDRIQVVTVREAVRMVA